MPRRSLSQKSFFDPEFVCPACLERGTVPWLLARFRSLLFPEWLTKGWRGEGNKGRRAWPPAVLLTLLFLRWSEEGMSRRASCRRIEKDAEWRAAMGLQMDAPTPTEKTVREFERFLRRRHVDVERPRFRLLHEHVVRVCMEAGVVGERPVWAADSTPMWCYGAVQDTVRLLGDGLRTVGFEWARLTGTTVAELAEQWTLPLLTAKSTKGAFRVNWKDADARATVLHRLAGEAVRVVRFVRRHLDEVRASKHKQLLRRCRGLLKVVHDDLEADEQGRLVVARRVAKGRLVSFTDLQARHGRKSRSRKFNGFKIHALGDVVSGLILAVSVTAGNVHDGAPAPRLIKRALALYDDIRQVLADTAYGGTALRKSMREQHGVRLFAPPPPASRRKPNSLSKNDFEIDFEVNMATCPNGISTTDHSLVRHGGRPGLTARYCWEPSACGQCTYEPRCPKVRAGRHGIFLHKHEQELRAAREEWKDPTVRQLYRTRSQCERLMNQVVRHGGRQARSWGLKAAEMQANIIAARSNLGVLAKKLAREERELQPAARAA